jgi:Rrf2 family transcriptional regulator, nitric oxide-sensitive transcriptional repressor
MFSQTVEYALRAMMYLASLDGAPVASERIAASTRVPPGYLSKVMRDLVLGRLVESFRGPRGGFVLATRPDSITILDVVRAVDPIRRIQSCPIGNPNHTELCPLHRRLDDALADIERSLGETTLAEMLDSDTEQWGGAAGPLSPGGGDGSSSRDQTP